MGALELTTSKADSFRIFAAAGTSLLGDGVRNAALPLLAVALSPTPAAVGIVTFAGTVPILLFTLLGGALADRHDPPWVLPTVPVVGDTHDPTRTSS
ncbi:hypothetical protein DMA12_46645 [Amycolatopsis balhimycina DSM 5908]|uniref:MFS transporter n=1 Tax=Amycolatopsis balhimycina DSM 5908 TaxID=1081091 RepID=A0A428VVJ8_AMYBA|nr:MFS transporter [Amycolatopsis balhimycina]RSM34837.1 hypothetical protein DMA12_46645 [Amycolatopsis balhimycina DSM 5908]